MDSFNLEERELGENFVLRAGMCVMEMKGTLASQQEL
jgi:hypothetical protein